MVFSTKITSNNEVEISQVQSDYVRLMEDMKNIWKKEVEGSEEARKVIRDLELHCKKTRNLLRELASAETWLKELEKKCYQMEEELKPNLLKLARDRSIHRP